VEILQVFVDEKYARVEEVIVAFVALLLQNDNAKIQDL
jgi:hypothetical protein